MTQEDIHKMGVWLQERKFGSSRPEQNPEFHKAYGADHGVKSV